MNASQPIDLPYFDILIEEIRRGKHDISVAFGRHVHWGYWADDHRPSGTMEDFDLAAEKMSRRVYGAARVKNGERVLDVGCGFGGTVASMNETHREMDLVGLNIDPRQLERARHEVTARQTNRVSFVEGDACAMPFPDASFDVITAVECVFHFPSRERFFAEAARVLKPNGRVSMCDVMPSQMGVRALTPFQEAIFGRYQRRLVGPNDVTCTAARHVEIARAAGFECDYEEDVTKNTLPTYPILRHVAREAGMHVMTAAWGTGGMEWLSRLKLLRYVILSFAKR